TATVEYMKDDEAGAAITSRLERVEIGPDDEGDEMSSCVIVECDGQVSPQKKASGDWGKGGADVALRQILMRLLADCGEQITPFADGPTVQALKLELLRAEFIKTWPALGAKNPGDAKSLAFRRAIKDAIKRKVIATRELNGADFVWLARTAEAAAARSSS